MTSPQSDATSDTSRSSRSTRRSNARWSICKDNLCMSDTLAKLRCHVVDTGYCLASEHHLIRGGARQTIHCHSIVALLEHPQHGWLLWDTGYAPRMLDATRWPPYRFYRWA